MGFLYVIARSALALRDEAIFNLTGDCFGRKCITLAMTSNGSCDDEKYGKQKQQTCEGAGSPDDEGQHAFFFPAIKI